MKKLFVAFSGCLTLALLVATQAISTQAESVRIFHYTHEGCVMDGRRILPTFADTGLVAIYEHQQHCLDAIDRMRVTCEWATHFQATNPDGHPWKAGEKDPRCLDVFQDEIPHCVQHYELQVPKCNSLEVRGSTVPFGPNWLVTGVQNCQVYAEDLTGGESATWSGDCVGGKAEGYGRLDWHNRTGYQTYTGHMRAGNPHGRGSYIYGQDGSYEGDFVNGNHHGHGVEIFANGDRYEGRFRNHQRHGHGDYDYANGQRYVGEWRNNEAHGHGTLTLTDGSYITGVFRDGAVNGNATFIHPNGARFEGQYRNHLPNGHGTLELPSGKQFEGTWRNGCYSDSYGQMAFVNATAEDCGFR